MTELNGAKKGRQTQWAAQFLAASELIRRRCTVSFTQGNNTPVADLMVGSPTDALYWVDVKGLSSKNAWLIKEQPERDDLFYILILLAGTDIEGIRKGDDQFFILSQQEINETIRMYAADHPNDRGVISGFGFAYAKDHLNRWDKLPS
jgi:hypothetical protein